MNEDKCKRCGKCYHYPFANKIKRCKYLVDLDNGLTECSIYDERLKKVIDITPEGHPVLCLMREKTKFWITGCPYNKAVWLRNKNGKHEVKL